jgi:hypothetical protein
MKNVVYLFLTAIFLSCSGSAHKVEAAYPDILTPQTIAFLLSEKPEDIDAGLYLYRNKLTRSLVVSFYTRVTDDAEITDAILSAAAEHDIPLPLAFSLAWAESSFRVRALNYNAHSVDRGLFQLNSRTFPDLEEEQFYDPKVNADYGLAHFRYCIEVGGSDLVALAMYNAGVNRVRRGTPFSTLRYVDKILDRERKLLESFDLMLIDNGEIAKVLVNYPS